MRKRRHRGDGERAKPKTGPLPAEDLRRAEDKIRGAFAPMDGPELEDLRFGWEEGFLAAHLTLRHKLDLGRGPGVENHPTECTPVGIRLDALLRMDEEALARVFEWEVSEGCLAPDLSILGFAEALMTMTAGPMPGTSRG